MNINHLMARCGTCTYWADAIIGRGRCDLTNQPNAPIELSDNGALYTRIDFGCLWYDMSVEIRAILKEEKEKSRG